MLDLGAFLLRLGGVLRLGITGDGFCLASGKFGSKSIGVPVLSKRGVDDVGHEQQHGCTRLPIDHVL